MSRILGTDSIQVALENEMREETHARYMRNLSSAVERGEETSTIHGQRLMTVHLDSFVAAIDAWKDEARGKRGRRHAALGWLDRIDTRTAAWLALREIINRVNTPKLRLVSLGMYIGRSILIEMDMRDLKKEDKALYTGILKVADKKTQMSRKVAAACFLHEKAGLEAHAASTSDCMLLGVKLVDIAVESLGIIESQLYGTYANVGGKATGQRAYVITPTPTLLKWIQDGHSQWIDLAPHYLPMCVPPAKWTTPLSGGYLTNAVRPLTLVKTRSKRYFRDLEECNMPQVYEAVNRIQETPWRINHNILATLQHLMEVGSTIGGLPSPTLADIPEKPADIDTNEEARKAYRDAARKVHEDNVIQIGRTAKVTSILRTAERYADFEAIYFPHQLDFRGRVYPVTTLSPQGEDFIKALLEFAEGEALGTDEAADWLAIHIANLFGVDKVAFDDRVLWTWQHDEMLQAIAADPFENRQWEDADKPFQALAAAFEWAGFRKDGLSHISRIPVALDGSCSGLQNFGMALRCEVTGAAVNLLPREKPADIYQDVIDKVHTQLVELVGADFALQQPEAISYRARKAIEPFYPQYKETHPDFESWVLQMTARKYDEDQKPLRLVGMDKQVYDAYWNVMAAYAWLQYGVNPDTGKMSRGISKRAVMTFAYGSKEFGFRDQIRDDIVRPDLKKNPNSVFKDCDWHAMGLMANLLWGAVNTTVVKAAQAMDWLQKAAGLVAKEGHKVSWQTPLGFLVHQGYVLNEEKLVETTFAGKERVRFTVLRETLKPDSRKQASSIAPNFVHSLDSTHLMLTVARAPDIKSWALIHDSFGTLPSRTQALFMYIRVAFLELYRDHDVLDDFRGQILKQLDAGVIEDLPSLPSKGNLDLHSVLQSKYCFA